MGLLFSLLLGLPTRGSRIVRAPLREPKSCPQGDRIDLQKSEKEKKVKEEENDNKHTHDDFQ